MAKKKRRTEKSSLEYPGHLFRPIEVATFIQTSVFTRDWERLGLTDDDLRALEVMIMAKPAGNPIIRGTGGLRKIRFSPTGWARGKSGALRACYAYFKDYGIVLLVVVYEKNEMDDLSPAGRKTAKLLIERQQLELAKGLRN
jgi:hypothetical protein